MRSLFLLFYCCLALVLQAQPPCGFDVVHQRSLQTDTAYARQVAAIEQSIQQFIQAHPQNRGTGKRGEAIYTVPLVVHIMHTGGAVGTNYNPDDAKVNQMVSFLNQVYSGTYPGLTPPSPTGAAGDLGLRFQLAARTPSCGATNGIDRVDASGLAGYTANGIALETSSGASELSMKNLARWDPSSYYNIWIVNKIDGQDGYSSTSAFIAGYAYLPGASQQLDGTVMLAYTVGGTDKTLPHEIGHAFSLYHPFEGSASTSQCPPNTNCSTQGDQVCDTDPITYNQPPGGSLSFTCRSGTNPCTNTAYSINTENNFMSYTNCYTLFTNGQKDRIQAALATGSRSSLVAAGNQALVPCGTVVNFTMSGDAKTEATSQITDCRRYTDYTYNMTIGSAPNTATTAILSFGGTATRGLDYDVTTNNNFTAPSTTLSFAAGSTTHQSFTLRVYNDASVESPESIILDFTVNNGGGNAAKGTTYPTLTISLADNDLAPAATGSKEAQIGSGNFNVSSFFNASLIGRKGQMLYRASELQAAGLSAGQITSLQYYISGKNSTTPYGSFELRMGSTTAYNNLYDANDGGLHVLSGLTTVFTSSGLNTVAGWNLFTLRTPFYWNGTDNIVVEFCYANPSTSSADQTSFFQDGGGSSQGNYFRQDGVSCSGSSDSYTISTGGLKPVIKFGIVATGTAIETAASSTVTEYLAAGSNDYFYSTGGKLLGRIAGVGNTLGCTTMGLSATGNTWQPFPAGGERSAKVFAITPAQNGSNTAYTVSLYFENSELGGKTPASLKLVKTNATTPDGASTANSVVVTPTVTAFGTGTIFSGNFTGFSSFFLADNPIVLPISLLSFEAKLNIAGNTVISWITTAEKDNAYFEVEASPDGTGFITIGNVASKGNSVTDQQYQFTHINPQNGITYYRLKQVDKNGKVNHSQVVVITKNSFTTVQPVIYPVPVRQTLHVQWGNLVKHGTIQLYSADMRLLQTKSVSTTTTTELDVHLLRPGVYYLHLTTKESGTVVKKFTKE